jgi:hypothetical protein
MDVRAQAARDMIKKHESDIERINREINGMSWELNRKYVEIRLDQIAERTRMIKELAISNLPEAEKIWVISAMDKILKSLADQRRRLKAK